MPPAALASSSALLSGVSPGMVLAGLHGHAGDAGVERVLHRVRARTGRAVRRDEFGARSWHPLDLHLALLHEVHAETGRDPAMMRAIGRDSAAAAESMVPGARTLLKLAGAKRLMRHAPKLWKTYARFGQVDVLEAQDGRGRLAFSGYETSPLFCRTMEGFFEGLLTRVGAVDVQIREVRCMADGHACCEFEGRWA